MKLKFVAGTFGKTRTDGRFFRERKKLEPLFGVTLPESARELLEEDDAVLVTHGESSSLCVKLPARGLDYLDSLRTAAFRMVRLAEKRRVQTLSLNFENMSAEEASAVFFGIFASSYHFDLFKSNPKKPFDVTVEIFAGKKAEAFKQLAEDVEIEHNYVSIAKDLINTPGSILTPSEFSDFAENLAKKVGCEVKVRTEKELEKENFNGLLTVGKGSLNPPRMLTISYSPGAKRARKGALSKVKEKSIPHLAIVGKGITFDCGGISLKPALKMGEMVSDMSGAAAALCALCTIAALEIPLKVTAILCLAENRIGPSATLPGDIFTAKNGKTVLIDNTDAEGRLILTDGLFEAGLSHATHIVDLATLTGAMTRALGYAMTGFFSNDATFAKIIQEASFSVGEKFWPMPLEEEYADSLKDKFADLKNTGSDAGAITAALFLKEFVPENTIWSHWDIAGPAFVTKPWKYNDYGATGVGIRTLVNLAKALGESA